MALDEYRKKRDFHKTSEPEGRPGKPHREPIFVVQEHHATRLHYDFRLEADGVLKSWAVPKGPSMDPAEKRLAVQVEDHPLAYASFAGTIPEGQYGAGTVTIWDHGTYKNLLAEKAEPLTVSEGIAAGRLEFELNGDKLKGRLALIRMQGRGHSRKDNWLLMKMKDEYALPGSAEDGKERTRKPATKTPRKESRPRAGTVNRSSAAKDGVVFSHTDKILLPDVGITKGDVLAYYRQVSRRLLPFLRDRPVTLERLPDGLGAGKPHFWQKDTPDYYPDWIPRIELPSERGKPVRYTLVGDVETLLYLVNQGALTFHVGFSRVGDLDHPDLVLFDLDPGEADFADAVAVARKLHELLQDEGEEAFVKTSGKTGLHVLVPWEQPGAFDEARAWASEVAARVAESLPEQATTERSKAKRQGRVYIDVMQNANGHHAVPPYVIRAVEAATVSMPLSWREVTETLDPHRFTPKAALRRLAQQKRGPMDRLALALKKVAVSSAH